jgi:hypothetical protein
MTEDVTLDFIAKRLRIQGEQAEMRSAINDMSAGQTVLTDMVLRLARDMVQIKDLLGRTERRDDANGTLRPLRLALDIAT